MSSKGLRLRGSSSLRDTEIFPADDESLGSSLFGQVTVALKRGMPSPTAFVFFEDRVDRFSMASIGSLTPRARRRVISAMAGQVGVECVAILGAFRFRGRGPLDGQWVASVFIEWPDNRWWTSWQPIGPNRGLVGLEPQIRTALDGSPRPSGVGGWFARARREGLRLRVQRESPAVH